MIWALRIVVLVGTAVTLVAQQSGDLLTRLTVPSERTRAALALRELGPAAATLLLDAIEQSDCRSPEVLCEELANLGSLTSDEVARLGKLIPLRAEPQRTSLLRALANGVLGNRDEAAVMTVVQQMPVWAQAGYFYSVDRDHPTFAWQEYVRLMRRLSLRKGGTRPEDLVRALDRICNDRMSIQAFLGGVGEPSDVHDLTSFGQHATREELEAIAELTLAHGTAAGAAVDELGAYLLCEPPRPAEILTESCAGIGEEAPCKSDAVAFPTLWRRDDWRFAAARAVFAISKQNTNRVHALRHLLHAPQPAERLEALVAVRAWPQPWAEFVPELSACLDSEDRLVVRETLVTFGLARGVELPNDRLREIAAGKDRELATLARRLMQ
jgi:hypothetical protein